MLRLGFRRNFLSVFSSYTDRKFLRNPNLNEIKEDLAPLMQLAQVVMRHSMINHCDRSITLLSDTDIAFVLFNLFTYFDMPFG